jgi:hypothetical protein
MQLRGLTQKQLLVKNLIEERKSGTNNSLVGNAVMPEKKKRVNIHQVNLSNQFFKR